ncbi:MAG: hypothetical protein WCF02_13015, partial [Azonexus sp.]
MLALRQSLANYIDAALFAMWNIPHLYQHSVALRKSSARQQSIPSAYNPDYVPTRLFIHGNRNRAQAAADPASGAATAVASAAGR